ncbi:hypothetical protein ACFC3F_11510 [Microbacterium sp. NPDC055910]|uniref:hypothetical protein n=1 Tax=Microbacterium sp. NPDC055910 TaxID=3345659 RepID=UPI0035D9080C
MRLVYEAEQRFWLHIPTGFPTSRFAGIAEWEADVTERYTESKPDAAPEEVRTVLGLARDAQRALSSTALFGLQFAPMPAPMAVTFEVEVGPPLSDPDAQLETLVGAVPLALPPVVDAVSAPKLGEGVIARFIAAGDDRNPRAGIGAFVAGETVGVRILSRATTTTLVGLVDARLRDLVESFRIEVDAD